VKENNRLENEAASVKMAKYLKHHQWRIESVSALKNEGKYEVAFFSLYRFFIAYSMA